jgi:hypothetical protein
MVSHVAPGEYMVPGPFHLSIDLKCHDSLEYELVHGMRTIFLLHLMHSNPVSLFQTVVVRVTTKMVVAATTLTTRRGKGKKLKQNVIWFCCFSSFQFVPSAKFDYCVSRIPSADLCLRRTTVSQENDVHLNLCLPNVDEHNLQNVENLSQPQECGEPCIGGGFVYWCSSLLPYQSGH